MLSNKINYYFQYFNLESMTPNMLGKELFKVLI